MKRSETHETHIPILSSKLTSMNQLDAKYAGFIDKIEFDVTSQNISTANYKAFTGTSNLSSIEGFFKNFKANYQITFNQSNKAYICINPIRSVVTKVIIKPSSTHNVTELLYIYESLWSYFKLWNAKLRRVDLTIDIKSDFSDTSCGFKVSYKRAVSNYMSYKQTGIYFGTGEEIIKAYDRREKNPKEINFPCTRIEIQLLRKKIPTETLSDLFSVLLDNEWHLSKKNPFNKISLNNVLLCVDPDSDKYRTLFYQLK
ncbi:MAG: hypothetical protein HON90_05880, partial [Halobacteriovoraceae bacterium]|nr:hypothetical protein [Halobacteriovoraceae bacterium]